MAEVLTYDRDKLKLFDDGVRVDENLPKWKRVVEEMEKDGAKKNVSSYALQTTGTDSTTAASTISPFNQQISVLVTNADWSEKADGDTLKFSEMASLGLRELNRYIKEHNISYYLRATGDYDNMGSWQVTYNDAPRITSLPEKKTFWTKLKEVFKKDDETVEEIPEFDAIQFFSKVKATSKESAQGYVNRVEKYLLAMKNAQAVGQTALMEKLVREMVANKYESFLAAEGYYHVVTEEQMVEFIKKSEKGIAIDYVKNFVRPIPMEVIEKITKASELEVFDNYVIVHYDPKGKNRQDTAREEYKKRDPIVFGVISGSHKLYYITDWIDDYCDLTLEKFVDTLGITKNDLVEDEEIKKTLPKEEPKKEDKKPVRKRTPKKETVKKETKKAPAKETVKKTTKNTNKKEN